MKYAKFFTLLILVLLTKSGFGQVLGPNDRSGGLPELRPGQASTVERAAQQRQRDMDNARRSTNDADPRLTENQPNSSPYFGDSASPKRKLAMIKEQERVALNGDVSPLTASPEYYTKYAAVLKDNKSGLARIYPDNNCFSKEQTVSVQQAEKCADAVWIMGDGSYYSFRLRSNYNQKFNNATPVTVKADRADIHYINGRIAVGGEYVQGLIAEVSGADFETLNKNSKEVKFLKDYEPKNDLPNVAEQKNLLKPGIAANGLTYSDSAAAKVGSVYVLRSVAYQLYAPNKSFSPDEIRLLNRIVDNVDYRTDVTVAFKIVGQEKDGSLVILWKELNQKDALLLRGLFK